jgi:hypothetical protein
VHEVPSKSVLACESVKKIDVELLVSLQRYTQHFDDPNSRHVSAIISICLFESNAFDDGDDETTNASLAPSDASCCAKSHPSCVCAFKMRTDLRWIVHGLRLWSKRNCKVTNRYKAFITVMGAQTITATTFHTQAINGTRTLVLRWWALTFLIVFADEGLDEDLEVGYTDRLEMLARPFSSAYALAAAAPVAEDRTDSCAALLRLRSAFDSFDW